VTSCCWELTLARAILVCSTGDSAGKRIERVAAEYNHVLYLVKKAGDLPFVRSLDPVRDSSRFSMTFVFQV